MSRKVIEWHGMPPGQEKDEMERFLVERTELLLFLIPLDRGYLTRADASGFYLEQQKNAWNIMNAYKVTRLRYHDYMAQVLRPRCIHYISRARRQSTDWSQLEYIAGRTDIERNFSVLNESSVPYMESYGGTINGDGEYMPEACCIELPRWDSKYREKIDRTVKGPGKKPDQMDLDEVLDHIRKARAKHDLTKSGQGEEDLKKKLEDERVREYFVELLLYIPDQERQVLSGHISRVLGVKSEIIDRFFTLRDELAGDRRRKLEKDRQLLNRHYRLMLKIDNGILQTDDEEEKENLRRNSQRLRTAYEKRLQDVRKNDHGLTQRQIASLVGVSRSLVSINLKRAREMLKETAGTILLKSEDAEDKLSIS